LVRDFKQHRHLSRPATRTPHAAFEQLERERLTARPHECFHVEVCARVEPDGAPGLVGSVNHGMEIERKHKDEIPELSLTDAIGKESPYKPSGKLVRLIARIVVNEPRYKKTGNLHSDGKIELFYKFVLIGLFLTTFIIAAMGGVTMKTPTWSWWDFTG
jgi:hypothetical protein